jgi:two-component system, NarL family, invasion response regulator UvrY
VKVLIVDKHAIVRAGLKKILTDGITGAKVDGVPTGVDAVRDVRIKKYDIILLESLLHDKSCLDVLRTIRRDDSKMPVIVMGVHTDHQYAIRSYRCGANGYLSKEADADEIINAVKKVHVGKLYVADFMADKLVGGVCGDNNECPHAVLSDREFDVMCMIASGESLTNIGEKLSLSVKTISTYRARVLSKMKLRSNSELTRYAISSGLI